MFVLKTLGLFIATAIAEIVGCYLPYLYLRDGRSAWLLVPAVLSLVVFVWLLSLHPTAAGRVYAAYGGVYVGVGFLWLWAVDRIQPTSPTCSASASPWSAWRSSCSGPGMHERAAPVLERVEMNGSSSSAASSDRCAATRSSSQCRRMHAPSAGTNARRCNNPSHSAALHEADAA